jgi:hypothetical protein
MVQPVNRATPYTFNLFAHLSLGAARAQANTSPNFGLA